MGDGAARLGCVRYVVTCIHTMRHLLLTVILSISTLLPGWAFAADLNDWGIPTGQISYPGYSLSFDDEREHPLKVCTTGKPCGNTCIRMSYTCHVGTGTATSTGTGVTTGTTSTTTTTTTTAWTPPAGTEAIKPPTPRVGCVAVQVVSVIDGDTVSVSNESGQLERVRLDQIDAPERSQAYGLQATQCLQSMVANQTVLLCRDGRDRYGRTIADILVNGADVGTSMVSAGCAWAYTRYLESGSTLPAMEAAAKVGNLGLWANGAATAPWQYRAGLQPVQTNAATGATVIPVSTQTTAAAWDRVFDWAEHKFPDATRYGSPTTHTSGVYMRCYQGGACLGFVNDRFQVIDPSGQAVDVGTLNDLNALVQADGF